MNKEALHHYILKEIVNGMYLEIEYVIKNLATKRIKSTVKNPPHRASLVAQ